MGGSVILDFLYIIIDSREQFLDIITTNPLIYIHMNVPLDI